MAMDISIIEEEFRRIKNMGFIPNVKSDSNDGAAGNTFEEILGVRENNLKEPDFENFEVKTKKNYLKSKSPISLFTLKPSFPNDGDSYMRNNWGVPDSRYQNVLRFSTSLYANRWSVVYKKNKYKIDVDKKQERVYIVRANLDGKVTDRTIYWEFDDIHNGAKKLLNLFLVEADVKTINNKLHFHYTSASVYYDYLGDQNFIDLLENGLIRYDNRLGVYGPKTPNAGKPHNHGGGFRLEKKNIDKLYKTVIEL
jgi:hypothetical protein